MLAVTDSASRVIRELVSRYDSDGGGGLRIAPMESTEAGFSLSVTDTPEPDDYVVAAENAEIFLEPIAAEVLDDKILDAAVDAQGDVSFSVVDQPDA